jgi:hypothetical protein
MPTIAVLSTAAGPKMGPLIADMARCPHCSVAKPNLMRVWSSDGPTARGDGQAPRCWAAYHCQTCGSIVAVRGLPTGKEFGLLEFFPPPKTAHEDIPEIARKFLQQAYETLHAPDAAAVMAGSAVDAMLKKHGLTEGSLYSRIDEALTRNLLTKGMSDWAHEVRLGSNRPRHADADKPHVTFEEAKQSVEFAEALGNFLFVLTAKIQRGLEAAKTKQPKG